jgi:hypothetical protein
MLSQIWSLAVFLMLAQGANAQETPRVVRQIAPDRFQPMLRDTGGVQAVPAVLVQPSKEHPLGACDRTSRHWTSCLRDTAELSNSMVVDAESRLVASLAQHSSLSSSFQGVLAKGLADADSKWRELRDLECGQLALLEIGPGKQLYESQMICQMTHNSARIDALSIQYGGNELNAASASSPR